MAVTTSGLVGEWVAKLAKNGTAPGNNTDPTSSWVDLIGSDDGTLTNCDYTTDDGWVGSGTASEPYALHSEGHTSASPVYVQFTTGSPWQNTSFSAEIWFYFTATYASDNQIILDNLVGNTGYRLYNGISTQNLTVRWGNGTTNIYDTVGAMTDGTWNHVVITYDGTTQKRYLNNGTATTDVLAYSANTTFNPRLGYSTQLGAPHMSFATLRLYSKDLSASEISDNYNAGVLASSLDGEAAFTGLTVTRTLSG